MRDNGPLTGIVRELHDDQLLISRTDAKGTIEYVNTDFAEISGFSEDELIGRSHNIVRHPAMPPVVFADLWADLQAGRPWIGILQNRCKNGDAYWVEAHVSPVWEQDRLVGFISIRRKARPEDIAAAQSLYATLGEADSGNRKFRHGRAAPATWPERASGAFANLSLATKFILALAMACAVLLGIGTQQLAAYLTGELDNKERQDLRHNVTLVRAAISARVESANIAVVEHSRRLNDRVYDAMGGRKQSSRDALQNLIARLPKEQGNPIESFMRDLRGAATIFIRTPDGFQRRLTTALDENGRPAVGTMMSGDHPALLGLLAGSGFVGPARVLGRQYLASYQPILDSRGEVIGASVIGIDIAEQLDTLKTELRAITVGETGYYYVVDASPGPNFGQALLHPYKEGSNLVDAGGPAIRALFEEMARNGKGEIRYYWRNEEAGEREPHKKLVIYDTIEKTNWIIAGGTAIAEFSALSRHVAMLVIGGGSAMTLAYFVIVLLLLRKLVLKPLTRQVLPSFRAISAGDFTTRLQLHGDDEISRVIQGLDTLRNRLAYENDRERSLSMMREQARQEAESLSRTRAEFLANMSHEIRTPLNAIIGLAYLLNQSKLEEREREYIRRVEGAGKLLLALINDVLDFSKIDAGRMQLEVADFRLDDVLDNLSNLVRTRLQEKKLLLEYVIAPNVPQTLRGDALRLSQILINLVGNAIKFTAEGAITIFVDAHPAEDGRIQLEFRIRDTGIGMTAEQQASLFRAFAQADTSITRKYGGTGLGLVICQRLVEMMGGSIAVESSPDSGSTFTFRVWFGLAENVVPAATVRDYRVLIVDDHALSRAILQRLLAKLGCSVVAVDSGRACLDILSDPTNPDFNCVMVDLNMPDMDGLELASRLRDRVERGTQLVAVTAENIHAARYRHTLIDFAAVIEKPVTATHLGEVITRLRDGTTARRPTASAEVAPGALAGMHILVAEDVPTNQLIMRDLLESLGAVVDIADNGAAAITQLAASPATDLILMDIQMPELDGLEATRRIRAGRERADIPIIALTAHAFDAERQRALSAGMNDFLTKPIEPEQLLSVLQRWRRSPMPEKPPATSVAAGPTTGTLDIDGVDTADGLRRMMGRRPLYEKVLREFAGRFDGEAARIRAALADGDRPGATRRAHSVKGTAGMIGATNLSSTASKLEQILKVEDGDPVQNLVEFEDELNRVLSGIRQTLGSA